MYAIRSYYEIYTKKPPMTCTADWHVSWPEWKKNTVITSYSIHYTKLYDLQYSVYHHKTNSEICQLMKFATENSVKTQKYKCKQKLMEIMEAHPALQEVLD